MGFEQKLLPRGQHGVMRPRLCFHLLPLAALVSFCFGFCPPRCVCDDTALEADCTDAQLDSFPISLNPRLRSLLLAGNGILRLDRSMMVSSYKELERLDLRDNRLESVQPGSFAQQGRLRELRLDNNRLQQLESSALIGLHQLRKLDLGGNQLDELPAGLLQAMPLLEDLNLSGNQLKYLSAASVAGAVSLLRLRLAGNQLTRLPSAALAQLPPLRELDLSYNQLERLRAGELGRTQSALVQLNLEGNQLGQLDEDALIGLAHLRRLILSRTGLVDLSGVALAPLTSLEELYLDGNPMTELTSELLRYVPSLRLLSFSGCTELRLIRADAFSQSPGLEELRLEDNERLSSLPAGVFLPPTHLRRLSLRGCALTTLSADAFASDRVQAQLSDNPWLCDCELRWLAELTDNVSASGAVCAEPVELRGQPVQGLTAAELGCAGRRDTAALLLAVALPCVAAVLALVLVAALVCRSRRRLGKRLRAFPWRDHLSVQRSKRPPPAAAAASTYYYKDTDSPGADGDGRLVPVTEL